MFNRSPKEEKFFDLFIANGEIGYKSAVLLKDFMNDFKNIDTKYAAIKEMEHDGDNQLHGIFEQLNKSFITPIDREDIHAIAKAMDDITDFIEQTASRFLMYNVVSIPADAKEVAGMIVDCTKEVVDLMIEMKSMKKSTKLVEKIIEINRIEEQGDAAYRKAIKDLFVNDTPALEVIKWKDIYENLEAVLDACEDVANIVEGVVMKHA